MGPLFIPPLRLNLKDINFDLDKVKRVYFQFYFDKDGEKNRFRLRAYAIGKKRKREEDIQPIILDVDQEVSQVDQNKYYFPQSAPELVLGQLELSNVQIKRLKKDVKSDFLRFTPREQEINPFCIVYDVSDGIQTITMETANPCPPARPPKDDAGES